MSTATVTNLNSLSAMPARTAEVNLRAAVAAALGSAPRTVKIAKSSDSRSLKCFGKTHSTNFFAKILLADPFPVYVAVPWHEVLIKSTTWRSAAEQIEIEWTRSAQMQQVLPKNSVPKPLGKSTEFQAIAWDSVAGESIVKMVSHKGRIPGSAKQLQAAMLQAGVWLRTLHKSAYSGSELFCPSDLLNDVLKQVQLSPPSEYNRKAAEILSAQISHLKIARVLAAVAVCHGDFTLTNLIWNSRQEQLCVVDYENSIQQPIWHDLVTVVFSLRKQLLNPLVPESLIDGMERAFWAGYGNVSSDLLGFIYALAISRILYYYPNRVVTRGERHGWFGSISGAIYRSVLQDKMTNRCLRSFPAELDLAAQSSASVPALTFKD